MKFKKWCLENGYTAKKIEELTGIKARNVFAYWQEERAPSRKKIKILVETLGVPIEVFY